MPSEKRRVIPKAPRRPLFFLPNFPYRLFTTNAESSTEPSSLLHDEKEWCNCSNQPFSYCQKVSEFEGIKEFVKHRSKWYELRLYEPVELQVEFLDAVAARLLVLTWYAIFVAAIVILVIPRVQWRVVNICGSSYSVDLRYVEKWTSPCATTYGASNEFDDRLSQPNGTYTVRWSLSDINLIQGDWPRYRRLVISLPTTSASSTNNITNRRANLQEVSVLYRIDVNVSISYQQEQEVQQVQTFRNVEVKCSASHSRCNLILLPLDFNFANKITDVSITLNEIPLTLLRSIQIDGAAVGIAFQRNAYTIAVLAWRYLFIFLSMLHIIRFIAHRKYTSSLYEKSWVIIFQIALIWFLNPLFALNLTHQPLSSVLAFIEYRIPSIFMAVTIGFMFSVMTASIQWRSHASQYFNITMSNQRKRHTDVNNTNNNNNNNYSVEQSNQLQNSTIVHHARNLNCQEPIAEIDRQHYNAKWCADLHRSQQHSSATANSVQSLSLTPRVADTHESKLSRWLWGRRDYLCDPPRWTKLVALVFVVLITVLDIADAALADQTWLSSSNLGEVTPGFILIHSFLLAGCVGCIGLLIYLHHTLGQKSYLESRPQQLACRVFILIFTSYIVYLIIHMCVFFFYYNGRYPVTSSLQPFLQLPMLMISVFQVNIMTFVYTNRGHEENVPVPANDKRWYSMIWPDTWYRWLARHGGSQYIFYTERQETRFYRLQLEFRRRQHLAKLKRKNELVSLKVKESTNSSSSNEHGNNNSDNTSKISNIEERSELHPDEVLVITVQTPLEEVEENQSGNFTQHNKADKSNAYNYNDNCYSQHHHYQHHHHHRSNRSKDDIEKYSNMKLENYLTASQQCLFHNVSRTLHTCNKSIERELIYAREQELDEPYAMQFRHSRVATECALQPQSSVVLSPILSHPITFHKSANSLVGTSNNYNISNNNSNNDRVYNKESICQYPLCLTSSVTTLRETKPSGFSRMASQRDCALEVLNMDRFSSFYLPDEEMICNMQRGEYTSSVRHENLASHHERFNQQEYDTNTSSTHGKKCSNQQFLQTSAPHRHLHLSLASSQQSNHEENNVVWVEEQQNEINSSSNTNHNSSNNVDIFPAHDQTNYGDDKECNQDVLPHQTTLCSFCNATQDDYCANERLQEEQQQSEEKEEQYSSQTFTVKEYEHHLPAPHGPMLRRAFTRARRKLGMWLGKAEEVFVEEPAHTFDKWETYLFNAIYKPFQSILYLPFFNLETAIDCINLSWEAYLTVKKEKSAIRNDVNTTKTRSRNDNNKITCNSNNSEEQEEEEEENEPATQRVFTVGNDPYLPNEQEQELQEQNREGRSEHGVRSQLHSTANCLTPLQEPNSLRSAPSASHQPVSVYIFNEEQTVHNDEQQTSSSLEEERKSEEKTGRMNVEQFGYTLLYTAMEKEVQVILCAMNVDAVEHNGKSPRLVIAFRGTVTARNAKYDLRLSRRVWQEMYDAELNDETYSTTHTSQYMSLWTHDNAQLSDRRNKSQQEEHEPVSYNHETHGQDEDNIESNIYSKNNNHHSGGANYWWNTAAPNIQEQNKHTEHSNWAQRCLHAFQNHTRLHPTVHTGFLKLWLALQPRVLTQLMHVLTTHRDIVFRIFTTGHSMGGALACLAAYSITLLLRRIHYPIPDITVYTFGQPRLGNLTFKRIYNKTVPRTFRVVNENDLVGTMTILGNYHIGIEVAIDRHGNFIVKPTAIETFFRPTKGHGLAVVQHMLSSYCISLNAIATNTSCKARCLKPYVTLSRHATEQTVTESVNDNVNSNINHYYYVNADAITPVNYYSNNNKSNDNNNNNNTILVNDSHYNKEINSASHTETPSTHSYTAIPQNEFTQEVEQERQVLEE